MRQCQFYGLIFLALLFLAPSVSGQTKSQHPDYKAEVILQPIPCCKGLRDGLYIGLGLGYDTYRAKQNIAVADIGGYPDNGRTTISSPGVLGDILLGYGRYFDFIYVAGEIFGTYSGANSSFAFNHYNSKFSASGSYGFSLIPGLPINNLALIYGRIGYTRTYFKVKEFQQGVFDYTATDWGNGLNLGVGIEVAARGNFSVRGEYNYITYQAFSTKLNTNTLSPADNQFILAVLYHFDFI